MTKPLLIDCIKNQKKGPDLRQFNLLIENLSPDDKSGHWFIVDIYFNLKNANEKNLLINKTCTDPSGRLVYQLMDTMWKTNKENLNSDKYYKKTQANMKRKVFIPLYAEHIHFLVKRAGCLVTKIYAHYTFEQLKLKNNFIIMN